MIDSQVESEELGRDEQPIPPADPARDAFDDRLAKQIARDADRILDLRIQLARAEEARRVYLNVLILIVFTIAWAYVWRSALEP